MQATGFQEQLDSDYDKALSTNSMLNISTFNQSCYYLLFLIQLTSTYLHNNSINEKQVQTTQ